MSKTKILMCSPDYFTVSYVINPWMYGNESNIVSQEAKMQWNKLYKELSKIAEISLIKPEDKLPDLVFTANAGLIYNNIFIPSNFHHKERKGEEKIFISWFRNNGYEIRELPSEISFEGAGDALFDREDKILWAGYGFRSSKHAIKELNKSIPFNIVPLKLIDSRFYHLDTCLCPLKNGFILYFPESFNDESIDKIKKYKNADKLIEVTEEDALHFSCNAVNIDNDIFLNNCSADLEKKLNQCGFNVIRVPLTEFLKSGGASKCLTLRLDEVHS